MLTAMNRKDRRATASREKHLKAYKRDCGHCTACCTILGVQSLSKNWYEKCQNEKNNFCSRYKERPDSCRNFSCQWLLGGLSKYDRPDIIGIIFDISEGGDLGIIPVAIEITSGSSKTGRGARAIKTIASKSPVLVVSRDGSRKLEGGPRGDEVPDIIGFFPDDPQLNEK